MQAFLTDIFQLTEVPIRLSKIFLVELENQRHYNDYRTVMSGDNNNLKDLLGEARAIHYAMQHGAIGYQDAKRLVQPILRSVNAIVELIAKQYQVKPRYVKFQDLGRHL